MKGSDVILAIFGAVLVATSLLELRYARATGSVRFGHNFGRPLVVDRATNPRQHRLAFASLIFTAATGAVMILAAIM